MAGGRRQLWLIPQPSRADREGQAWWPGALVARTNTCSPFLAQLVIREITLDFLYVKMVLYHVLCALKTFLYL